MIIRRGMSGDLVREVQHRLQQLSVYGGPLDGSFGGGTEAAVKTFQKMQGIRASGLVDADTWAKLLPGELPPVSALESAPLATRCLALTGSFETGFLPPDCFCGVTGDFDGQGISFGVLQWNLGQGTLQNLLREAFEQHAPVCRNIFHEQFETVQSLGTADREQQLAFAQSIQTRGQVHEPWQGMLKTLGRTSEFQEIQVRHASSVFDRAVELCRDYGLTSERGVALMFDILTQNGGIGSVVKAQIQADVITAGGAKVDEVTRLKFIANRRAAASRPEFLDDVRTRKLTIAEGAGTVHGIFYDLEDIFGITLRQFMVPAAASQPA